MMISSVLPGRRRASAGGVLGTLPLLVPGLVAVSLLPQAGAVRAETPLVPISVDSAPDMTCPLDSGSLDKRQIAAQALVGASDTARLLAGQPGVAVATGGGLSGLPIVHGLADDRLRTTVGGVPITSACPNHMNPALSYIAPSASGHLNVVAGITPVSAGGDSIGGTVAADPEDPVFAAPDEQVALHGRISTTFRSVNRQIGTSGAASAATDAIAIGYDGSWTRARESHDGAGDRIAASRFETQSHNGVFSVRGDAGQLTIRGGHQITPYEGFPNARMDLTGNTSNYLNARYTGDYGWGRLDALAYWQNARHAMDFLSGRNTTGHMPMNTNGTDAGYSLKAEIPLSHEDLLRLGNEYHGYRLSDWWPPISGVPHGMMSPYPFINLNEATRRQFGSFAEWEHRWDARWTSLLGVRNDVITMNTGAASGYSDNMMAGYAADAAAFNSQSHGKTDVNEDLTATVRYEASAISTGELGIARKTRAPNLYERYAWSTGNMAASMIGWFGNGTEYVGNLHLKPETANTVSISSGWHDTARADWSITVTPYYTYVQDYISADPVRGTSTPGISLLQFANHDAQLFGFDLAGSKALIRNSRFGDLDVDGTVGWVKGMRTDGGGRLYRMQPLNALLSLRHSLGSWNTTAEVRMVNDKSVVNPVQNEQTTPGFAIVNWRTSYSLGPVTVAAGIDNLLNKQYYDPNGGAYVSYWRATNTRAPMGPLPGAGRSFNAGVSVAF
ncbi:MAG: TonB-dependent receptor plug domain-containing protein [Telmatospirillum sp.]|nr:TonB-dependent receptor plug domain-containing protein [Telmatospirillum sp.]